MSKTCKRWLYTALCLTVLLALFLFWWIKTPPASVPAAVSAIEVTVLFALLGIRFIPHWMSAWSAQAEARPAAASVPRFTYLKLIAIALGSRAVIFVILYAMQRINGEPGSMGSLAESLWLSGDGIHYLDIAQRWYQSHGSIHEIVRLVFLPLYPIAIRVFHLVFSNWFISALLVPLCAFTGAVCALYRLMRLDMGHEAALRAVKYLCLLPSTFFFNAPMSDSLFLLWSLLCVYFARNKKYYLAGVFGALASFTRSVGLALLVPVCFELIADAVPAWKAGPKAFSRIARRFPAVLLIPLGFAAYLYINYLVSGNPFQYTIYQREHWGQNLGFFFNTAAYLVQSAISYFGTDVAVTIPGLTIPNLLYMSGSLVLMLLAVRRIRASYGAYFIAYYVFALGVTWLLSGPRYIAALFPIYPALVVLTGKRRTDSILSILFVIMMLLYMWAFACRWQVF